MTTNNVRQVPPSLMDDIEAKTDAVAALIKAGASNEEVDTAIYDAFAAFDAVLAVKDQTND